MIRSLVPMSLVLASIVSLTLTTDAEARCRQRRSRCCNTACAAPAPVCSQPAVYSAPSTCCGQSMSSSMTMTPQPMVEMQSGTSQYVAKPAMPSNSTHPGYASPTNVETRPKTSETATEAGPAPAGESPVAEEAPRPGA